MFQDAHNCILDYDKNTSFFAVYDGHGGREVAEYTARNLPEFLKCIEAYKNGDFEKALVDAFIDFDATLTEESVIAKLTAIALENSDDEGRGEHALFYLRIIRLAFSFCLYIGTIIQCKYIEDYLTIYIHLFKLYKLVFVYVCTESIYVHL